MLEILLKSSFLLARKSTYQWRVDICNSQEVNDYKNWNGETFAHKSDLAIKLKLLCKALVWLAWWHFKQHLFDGRINNKIFTECSIHKNYSKKITKFFIKQNKILLTNK